MFTTTHRRRDSLRRDVAKNKHQSTLKNGKHVRKSGNKPRRFAHHNNKPPSHYAKDIHLNFKKYKYQDKKKPLTAADDELAYYAKYARDSTVPGDTGLQPIREDGGDLKSLTTGFEQQAHIVKDTNTWHCPKCGAEHELAYGTPHCGNCSWAPKTHVPTIIFHKRAIKASIKRKKARYRKKKSKVYTVQYWPSQWKTSSPSAPQEAQEENFWDSFENSAPQEAQEEKACAQPHDQEEDHAWSDWTWTRSDAGRAETADSESAWSVAGSELLQPQDTTSESAWSVVAASENDSEWSVLP